jgi:endonuclease YncB( thermonuclease family)
VHADVQLGCDVSINLTLRLAGIDAPELCVDGKPNQAGIEAKTHLRSLLLQPNSTTPVVTLSTIKDRRARYGRYLPPVTPSSMGYFTQALVSLEAKDGDRPTETTPVDPHGMERR